MSRPTKTLDPKHDVLLWNFHRAGMGLRRIANLISIERGAYKVSLTLAERRRRTVGKDFIKAQIERLKTEASENPSRVPNAVARLESQSDLDVRWSEPQMKSSGVNDGTF